MAKIYILTFQDEYGSNIMTATTNQLYAMTLANSINTQNEGDDDAPYVEICEIEENNTIPFKFTFYYDGRWEWEYTVHMGMSIKDRVRRHHKHDEQLDMWEDDAYEVYVCSDSVANGFDKAREILEEYKAKKLIVKQA